MPSDDRSVSGDSVFDWGPTSAASLAAGLEDGDMMDDHDDDAPVPRGGGSAYNGNEDVLRYDPQTMSRVTDIVDGLMDDSSDSDSEHDVDGTRNNGRTGAAATTVVENGNKRNRQSTKRTKYGPGGAGSALCYRQTMIIASLVAIIIGASVAIGVTILSGDPDKKPYSVGKAPSDGMGAQQQQEMLEMAERVIIACSENRLDEDLAECQNLCRSKMCCFEIGDYSCESDKSKECAVYAGCEA
eukprot:156547_1